jgi:hypothetical protein
VTSVSVAQLPQADSQAGENRPPGTTGPAPGCCAGSGRPAASW